MKRVPHLNLPSVGTLAAAAAPFWMELVLRGALFGGMFCAPWTYLLPLSLSAGCLLVLLSLFFPARARRAAGAVLLILTAFLYCAVTVYTGIFGVLPSLYSVTGAGQVLQFWRETLSCARRLLPWLALYFVPCAVWLFGSAPNRRGGLARVPAALAACLLFYGAELGLIACADEGAYSPRSLYFKQFVPMRSARMFGVLTTLELDARRLLIGGEEELSLPQEELPVEETQYEPNTMDFDFSALAEAESDGGLKTLHRYFAAQKPTFQNEYTGLFKGKNLVLVTAEGWSPYAVSEELTPTLYKMLHGGFVFENYYNPIWGVSTTDGEYAACVGLLPKAGVWSFFQSGSNLLPFCMGNQLSSLGYTALAYHNHLFDYYRRDVSHPNMGYVYKGYGNGLNVTYTWPESDLEMIELTADEYIGKEPFVAYYMTVSGHLNYTFEGNSMAARHRDVVESLPYSDNAKAYIACNYELELAMTELLARLEAAGISEDTVFCITPDHYPYGLAKETLDELAGHPVEETFELYKSCLVLWSPSMEKPVPVQKPCAPVDILPTLSNLFGLPYDSRLLMGRDILSSSPGLVVFNSRSYITDQGRYDADRDVFLPAGGTKVSDGYAASISQQVDAKFTVSARILETDYYRALWREAGLAE